jgi:hypothetical protein
MNRLRINSQRGMAALIALLMVGMLTLLGLAALSISDDEITVAGNALQETKAFNLAEAGIERSLAQLKNNPAWRAGYNSEFLGAGTYAVVVLDSASMPALDDSLLLKSTGESDHARCVIEALLAPSGAHPLFNHAIYAGNREEYDPDADSQAWVSEMTFSGTGADKDIVNGDVFFNGHVDVTGDAAINGTVDAGGDIAGNPPSGDANSGVDYLAPPDLAGMNYESTADLVVSNAASWDAQGHLLASDPRHIFVKEFRKDLADQMGFEFDNTNFFLGDPYEGGNINKVSVSTSGNHKTYFVDGNLWIEPMGTTSQIVKSPPDGTQITIVAKGNIYFSDDLMYDNEDLDAIAFMAMTDGESYTDLNGDNQYTPGEPILHDDGDGIYEGPSEGSGNIKFGDPNGGPLGHVHGFLYAENNFEDHVLDPKSGAPLDFQITGTMSAGNLLRINRDFGGQHAQMIVNYDTRLSDGTINLPGLPPAAGGSGSGWVLVAWRELY